MKNFCLVNRKKVKQYTSRIGRPAGDIIFSQGHMYRPTQYGVNTYGGKIIFKEFSYNPVSYEYKENDISEISPSMLKNISKIPTPLGCHTYNSVGNIEIIDIKYKSFSLFRPIRILFKKLELGGYRYYEGK